MYLCAFLNVLLTVWMYFILFIRFIAICIYVCMSLYHCCNCCYVQLCMYLLILVIVGSILSSFLIAAIFYCLTLGIFSRTPQNLSITIIFVLCISFETISLILNLLFSFSLCNFFYFKYVCNFFVIFFCNIWPSFFCYFYYYFCLLNAFSCNFCLFFICVCLCFFFALLTSHCPLCPLYVVCVISIGTCNTADNFYS